MYLPLLGGFLAIVLVSLLLGRIMDTSRHDSDADHKPPLIRPRR